MNGTPTTTNTIRGKTATTSITFYHEYLPMSEVLVTVTGEGGERRGEDSGGGEKRRKKKKRKKRSKEREEEKGDRGRKGRGRGKGKSVAIKFKNRTIMINYRLYNCVIRQ